MPTLDHSSARRRALLATSRTVSRAAGTSHRPAITGSVTRATRDSTKNEIPPSGARTPRLPPRPQVAPAPLAIRPAPPKSIAARLLVSTGPPRLASLLLCDAVAKERGGENPTFHAAPNGGREVTASAGGRFPCYPAARDGMK